MQFSDLISLCIGLHLLCVIEHIPPKEAQTAVQSYSCENRVGREDEASKACKNDHAKSHVQRACHPEERFGGGSHGHRRDSSHHETRPSCSLENDGASKKSNRAYHQPHPSCGHTPENLLGPGGLRLVDSHTSDHGGDATKTTHNEGTHDSSASYSMCNT